MNTLSQEDVIQILKLVDESNTDELHLEMGELKLTVKKSTGLTSSPGEISALQTESSSSATLDLVRTEGKAPPADSGTVAVDNKGLTAIRASMLGTFYKSPKPGEPPFVEVGQIISAQDTVCIVEVMKLFSTIKAGINGRIAEMCVQDGELVEFDQTLFWVEELDTKTSSEGIETL